MRRNSSKGGGGGDDDDDDENHGDGGDGSTKPQGRLRHKVPRKRVIKSLKGGTAVPKWMCLKVAGTLMQARIEYEKEQSERGIQVEMLEQDFGEFVEDRFVEMYGMKKMAHDHLRDFVKGLKRWSDSHVRLKVFRILTGLVPGDDLNNVSVTDSAATFYRLAIRLIMETATDDHITKLKGVAFWTHYQKTDVVKFPVLYYEKVTEKIGAIVKKLHSDAEQAKTQAERSWSAKHEVDVIRGFKAFELTLKDHASGKLIKMMEQSEAPDKDGNKPKVFVYGDASSGRATAAGEKALPPICIDTFLSCAIDHWSSFEDLEEEQVLKAFGSWDENGDGQLNLNEFALMVKYSNRSVSQRKITRAFVASAGGGEHVDKARLSATLLAHGLVLVDRPPGELPTLESMASDLDADSLMSGGGGGEIAATATAPGTAPGLSQAIGKIGTMMHVIQSLGPRAADCASEEELLNAAAAETIPAS